MGITRSKIEKGAKTKKKKAGQSHTKSNVPQSHGKVTHSQRQEHRKRQRKKNAEELDNNRVQNWVPNNVRGTDQSTLEHSFRNTNQKGT